MYFIKQNKISFKKAKRLPMKQWEMLTYLLFALMFITNIKIFNCNYRNVFLQGLSEKYPTFL